MNRLHSAVERSFYAKFGGKLRPIQNLVLSELSFDRDALVIAGTGSGKTEAVFSLVANDIWQNGTSNDDLLAVVVTPTRALASDLYSRLEPIFRDLRIRVDIETGDKRTTSGKYPANILIKTPEGLDATLCNKNHSLEALKYVIIDEIHRDLFNPRGTQLVGLLYRISLIAPSHLRFGISATVHDTGIFNKLGFLRDTQIIRNESSNVYEYHDHVWDPSDHPKSTAQIIGRLRSDGFKKVIAFANSKRKVEEIARSFNLSWLSGSCWAHHASQTAQERRLIEARFRKTKVGMLVATSTMEVGVDIGDVEACLLFDPPPDIHSFKQRAGRAGRRSGQQTVYCLRDKKTRKIDYVYLRSPSRTAVNNRFSDPKHFLTGVFQQACSYVREKEVVGRKELIDFVAESFKISSEASIRVVDSLLAKDLLFEIDTNITVSRAPSQRNYNHGQHMTFATTTTTRKLENGDATYGPPARSIYEVFAAKEKVKIGPELRV